MATSRGWSVKRPYEGRDSTQPDSSPDFNSDAFSSNLFGGQGQLVAGSNPDSSFSGAEGGSAASPGAGAASDAGSSGDSQSATGTTLSANEDIYYAVNGVAATQEFGLNGAGITVGIISNSFNAVSGDLSRAIADGLVNPNAVDAHDDSQGTEDEGLAMAEIVHEIAPAANIVFYSGVVPGVSGINGVTEASMSTAINVLATPKGQAVPNGENGAGQQGQGANIIVDDLFTLNQPLYQPGDLIDQAINSSVANDVTYFTLAGNAGATSFYADSTSNDSFDRTISFSFNNQSQAYAAYNFGTNTSPSAYEFVTIPAGSSGSAASIGLDWEQPWQSIDQNGNVPQYYLEYLLFPDVNGAPGATPMYWGAGDGSEDAMESGTATPGNYFLSIVVTSNAGSSSNTNPSIGTAANPNIIPTNDGIFKIIFDKNGAATVSLQAYSLATKAITADPRAGTGSGTVWGHSEDPNAITVGAVNYINTPAFGDNTPQNEVFSSAGPAEYLYNQNGTPLTSPDILNKVNISAPDGATTDVPGLTNFTGTSAAGPAAAAVAALMLQADPHLTPTQIDSILENTATPFGSNSDQSGAGLINAAAALQQLIDVTPPVLVHDNTVTAGIGLSTTISSSQLQFTDNVSTDAQETYSVVTGPTHGTLFDNGIAAITFTQADVDNGLVKYTENGNIVSSDSLTFKVTDSSGNSTTTEQLNFQIADQTPPAQIHNVSTTVALGSTASLASSQLQFTDNVSTDAQETYTILTAPADGKLLKGGSAVTTFTQADIDNSLISYQNTTVASSDGFTFKVADAAGNSTANEQFQFQLVDKTPPSSTHVGSVTVGLFHTVNISAALLQFDDNVSTHAQETYTVTSPTADGTLLKNGVAVASFTQADIDNGLISYQENGTVASADSFAFKVTDAAGNSTAAQSFQISILPPVDMAMRNTGSGALEFYAITNNQYIGFYAMGQIGLEWALSGFGNFSGNANETDMLMRNSSTGAFELYDISSNSYTGFHSMGQVGPEWQVAGFGDFSGNANETDMLMQSSATGAFELYDISNNQFTGFHSMGQVGAPWQVAGFGDFSSNANETDMLMRNSSTGAFELYDISNNSYTGFHSLGQVGPEWQVAGFGDFSGNANETDMLMRDSANGAFELYDISNNQFTGFHSMGQVGAPWQVAGFGDFSGNVSETDMLMRNSSTGAFELYDISKNAYSGFYSLGQVGPAWTVAGIEANTPSTPVPLASQLVQAISTLAPSSGSTSSGQTADPQTNQMSQILVTPPAG